MGLEPTTFCMANASSSSRPFAPVRSNARLQDVPENRANATAPERTPNLAILATEAHPQGERNCVVCGRPFRCRPNALVCSADCRRERKLGFAYPTGL
jgi:hypothetical protein